MLVSHTRGISGLESAFPSKVRPDPSSSLYPRRDFQQICHHRETENHCHLRSIPGYLSRFEAPRLGTIRRGLEALPAKIMPLHIAPLLPCMPFLRNAACRTYAAPLANVLHRLISELEAEELDSMEAG